MSTRFKLSNLKSDKPVEHDWDGISIGKFVKIPGQGVIYMKIEGGDAVLIHEAGPGRILRFEVCKTYTWNYVSNTRLTIEID